MHGQQLVPLGDTRFFVPESASIRQSIPVGDNILEQTLNVPVEVLLSTGASGVTWNSSYAW